MTEYEPDPTRTEPREGDRVRVGEIEGRWYPCGVRSAVYTAYIENGVTLAYVIKGIPVTVLREVVDNTADLTPGRYEVTRESGRTSALNPWTLDADGVWRDCGGNAHDRAERYLRTATFKRLPDPEPRWTGEPVDVEELARLLARFMDLTCDGCSWDAARAVLDHLGIPAADPS